jgi:hypothetical protein
MLNILLIAVVTVCIVDISGFTDSWKSAFKRLVTRGRMSDPYYSLKPFDCSLCMTFWSGLVYLWVTHSFTLWMVTFLLLISVMTPVIKDFIILIRETLIKIIRLLL